LSIKDREELARDMCHSVNTQAQYQFIVPRLLQNFEGSAQE